MRVSLLSLLVVAILCSCGFLMASAEQNPLEPYQPRTFGADGSPLANMPRKLNATELAKLNGGKPSPLGPPTVRPGALQGGGSSRRGGDGAPVPKMLKVNVGAGAPTAPGAKKAYYNVRQTDVDPNAPKKNRGQFAKKPKPAAPLPPVTPPTPSAAPARVAPAVAKNYGDICGTNNDCRGGLTCESEVSTNSKYCRDHILRLGAACHDDSRCPAGSICLQGANSVTYCTIGKREAESGYCRKSTIKDKSRYVCIDKKVQLKTANNAKENGKGCDCYYNQEESDCPNVKDGAQQGQYECSGPTASQYTCNKKW
jgi:hypothetical protein